MLTPSLFFLKLKHSFLPNKVRIHSNKENGYVEPGVERYSIAPTYSSELNFLGAGAISIKMIFYFIGCINSGTVQQTN